jgi:hypothetical protein
MAISGDDAATYDGATAQLATQPTGGCVLGDVLRSLLEDTHPDGLNSDDVTLIGQCYRAAAAWLPEGCRFSLRGVSRDDALLAS